MPNVRIEILLRNEINTISYMLIRHVDYDRRNLESYARRLMI